MKKTVSMILIIMIICSLLITAFVSGASAVTGISYEFMGKNKDDVGYAQGRITVTGESGTYYLYWSDGSKALDGYKEICKFTLNGSSPFVFEFSENAAIPKGTDGLLLFKSSTEPTDKSVRNALSHYIFTESKKIADDMSYSFAAFSDTHIDEEGSHYPYDEGHFRKALDCAADRNVDFIVTSGDHVNNQCLDYGDKRYNPYWMYEWNAYSKVLSESSYCNPIYEGIGNHELWNGDTETNPKSNQAGHTQYNYFIKTTGLDSDTLSVRNGKAYYEITEPKTGDHFIFLALEGGFYTDRVEEFSDEQLNWLEGKLNAYKDDGKRIYIIEHANFYKWGAGDLLDNPLYDIPLKTSCSSTLRLQTILKNYKNAAVITGHTHFQFSDVPNVSDNGGTSSYILHNSSVGGVRKIVNGKRVNAHDVESLCLGYIVEKYGDAAVFYGIDFYTNKKLPEYSYIIGTAQGKPEPTVIPYEPTKPTHSPTLESQTEKTEILTDFQSSNTEDTTESAVQTESTVIVTEQSESAVQTEPAQNESTESIQTEPTQTEEINILGDTDGSGSIDISDATWIQRHMAKLIVLEDSWYRRSLVNNGKTLSITDATLIQQKLAKLISKFPAEKDIASTGAISLSDAENLLSKQYIYSSYDQYQRLKKAVRDYKNSQTDFSTVSSSYEALLSIVNRYGRIGDTYDVYFTDSKNWSNVYAYAWDGSTKNKTWPGEKMTLAATNSYGEKIYKISLSAQKYKNIIFSNGNGTQTADLKLIYTYNPQYYPLYSSNGKYNCGVTVYNLSLQ